MSKTFDAQSILLARQCKFTYTCTACSANCRVSFEATARCFEQGNEKVFVATNIPLPVDCRHGRATNWRLDRVEIEEDDA